MRVLQFAANVSKAIGPITGLSIFNAIVSPDGFSRPAIVVNGQTPAPLIRGQKGDHFSIQVTDWLYNETMMTATTIHWHGIDQLHSNWADGVGMVTQCPLVPGETFNYNFATREQSGTYWYHSHWSTQYCDGMRGPLVVYDPDDPHKDLYDVDNDDTVITVSDWYHTSPQLITGVAQSDATLINGVGRYQNGPLVDLTTLQVEQGKRYRFRLVSLSCEPNYNFSIDGHQMTILEADGNNVQPLTVDSIQIFAGQRYSFVVEANQTVDNYWIRAIPNFGHTGTNITGGLNAAILRYAGASSADPNSTSTLVNPLNETNLHALTDPAAPGEPVAGGADVTLTLQVNFTGGLFSINGTSFDAPKVPVLLQILSGAHTVQELLPAGSVYELPGGNKSIELTIRPPTVNAGDPHPVHLHGHDFSVVRSGGTTATNYVDPVRRDVVSLGPTGGPGATIRFRTDNPGPWFLHCHIDFHLNAGFAAVLAVAPNQTYQDIVPVPYDWYNLCPVYYSYNISQQALMD